MRQLKNVMKYYFWCVEIYDSEGDLIGKPSGTISMSDDGTPDAAFEALREQLAEEHPDCVVVVVAFNNIL